ncbi:hypothetical protein C0995_002181 [Termitomyces sp. Mi166|nr:hypothetical protein C0995_002181 [Termitomyces sp. Mi166\
MPVSTPNRHGQLPAREIIRHFSPTWFAATMGTGAVSILFSSFPYGHDMQPMRALSLVFFFLNLLLFVVLSALTIARYTKYPHTWFPMLHHPTQSLYTSCFPMGITTLINVSVDVINVSYNFGGPRFLYFIWAIWWIDVLLSVLCCWGLVHIIFTVHAHALQQMTAVWLLPVVTLTVAASTGGILSRTLYRYSPHHALITTTTAVFLLTVGLTLALMIITIYMQRLMIHGLPPGYKILSVFLPLGPTAQSGFAVLLIGQNFRTLLPFEVMCIIFALLGIYDTLRRTHVPFALTFWGLVFPNGVFANLTITLSKTFDSGFFRVLGSIYAGATLGVWIFVATRTAFVVYDRSIFEKEVDVDVDVDVDGRRSRSNSREPLIMRNSVGSLAE